MLNKTLLSIAAAALLGGVVETRVAYAGDDIWDLMNPGWWMDQIDDDDDDWRYRRYGPGPYGFGSPYGWGYPAGYGYPPPPAAKKKKPPELPLPE